MGVRPSPLEERESADARGDLSTKRYIVGMQRFSLETGDDGRNRAAGQIAKGEKGWTKSGCFHKTYRRRKLEHSIHV